MAYIDHNILRNQPNENLFASFVEGGKMSDILRKRRFGRELDTQARDFDITSPEGQVMLMQALSQVGYGREVANLQKSHFDPDSREKQRQYGRDDSVRGMIQSRIDEMMGNPMAGLELNEPPSGRFPQQSQGQFQSQQPGRFQEPRSGEPGGTQDLRPEWLKGLMGMFGGGQQGPSYGMPQIPGQQGQGGGFQAQPMPYNPQTAQGFQNAPMPNRPGMGGSTQQMPMDPALGAALDRSDQGIPRNLSPQGVTGADSTELMRQATDRYLQGPQQPAQRPSAEDTMMWNALKYSANPAQAYLDYQRDKQASAAKVNREQWDKVESADGTIDYVNRETGLNREGKKVKFYKAPKSGQRDRYSFQTINGRKIQINLDTGEKIDLGPDSLERNKPRTPSGMPLRALGDTELKSIKDIQNTAFSINKIQTLVDNITGLKRGPIAGRIFGKNPYDTELQALERLVKQTVPGMARGVFGEVGVLTDSDVERYTQMLASVKDDPGLAQVILDELNDKITSAYQISLDTYERGGRDISGFDKSWTTKTPRTSGSKKAPVGFAGYTDADEKKLQELEAKAKGGK